MGKGGKGSQLTQLKAAVSQAGLGSRPQAGKKRKRSRTDEVDKEKKAAKLKDIHQKLNPFDLKVTKVKHDVGGRKIKGVTGRPAQSKQAGLEERKRTLLKEYETKNHSGGIVDRRFGENDPTMTPEERMLERFTRERQRASKGAAFNIEDDDEELTHYGQSLSKLDDFDDVHLAHGDDEDEETRGQIDSMTVNRAHFGGFEDEDEDEEAEDGQPARKKSKAEVMSEVIAKSKDHKYRRQAEKDEDENLRHQLDEDFDSIRALLYSAQDATSGEADKAISSLVGNEARDQEYDQFVREFAFEKRAKPKDRTKTEEELALEEKERLEKAERKRLRRMVGEDDYDSEDEDEEGNIRVKRKRPRGGDDLEDDFDEEEFGGLGEGLKEGGLVDGGEEVDGSEKGSEAEAGNEDESESGDEEGDEALSDEDEDEESETGEPEELVVSAKKRKIGSKIKSKNTSKELPYTFQCPSTHDEFLEIVEDVDDKDVPTIIQRIRALYHPSLAEGNKFKLQGLTSVLIDHILYITSPPTPRFTLLSSLIPHLASLTESYPIQSAEYFVEKLSLMHKNLKRGLSHGPKNPESKTWPRLPELCLLRVTGLIWSTSDMKHPVISPARLLMGSYLGLGRVRSVSDLASGLFLCTLFLQYEERSKRFVPEAINFTINTVLHFVPYGYEDVSQVPGYFPCPDFRSELCMPLAINAKKAKGAVSKKPDLAELLSGRGQSEQDKVDLLGLSFDLLGRFAEMYKGLDGFIELYEPILVVLEKIGSCRLPQSLKDRLTALVDQLSRLLKFSRQSRRPLQLQSHKPIPIPSYIPKFESSSSNYLRNRDPDHERNAAAKLRRQYKEEKKGALRELRKDTRFLADVKQKEQAAKDKSYHDSMKKVFGSIEGERAEEKAMQREKVKEKKRSGRK